MRHFLARITLRNGHQAKVDVVARSGCDAIVQLLDQYGARLLRVGVRPS